MIISMIGEGDKTRVTARSLITKKIQTMIINTSRANIEAWMNGKSNIQSALSELTKEEREFLISGITPEEWKTHVTDVKEW